MNTPENNPPENTPPPDRPAPPPAVPPKPLPEPPPIPPGAAPGEARFARRPIDGAVHMLTVVEALLKHPGRILHEIGGARAGAVCLALGLTALLCLAIYGVVAGSLSGGSQLLIAPVKILLGSILCVFICLPSLFIFLCLGGTDVKFRTVAGELLAAVSLTALMLIGFAPVAWVFSQSTDSILLMGFLHLVFWSISLYFGLRLIGSSSGSRMSGVWIAIYVVVCLQMMTALRPIVGRSDTFLPGEKKFFFVHMLETMANAAGDSRTPQSQ